MKAIRVHRHGGPDVLAYEDVDTGQPAPGKVRVRALHRVSRSRRWLSWRN